MQHLKLWAEGHALILGLEHDLTMAYPLSEECLQQTGGKLHICPLECILAKPTSHSEL